MKRFVVLLTMFGLLLPIFEADLMAQGKSKNKNFVPPGLEKKGGVPPGQAKKQKRYKGKKQKGAREEVENVEESVEETRKTTRENSESKVEVPTTTTTTTKTTTTTAGSKNTVDTKPVTAKASRQSAPTVKAVAKKEAPALERVDPNKKVSKDVQRRRENLGNNVSELNKLGKNKAAHDKIVQRLSKNTRVPVTELTAQEKKYPGLGVGDLYVANHIAKKSKKPVDRIISQYEAGHSWGVLANEYKANLGDLVSNTKQTTTTAKRASK